MKNLLIMLGLTLCFGCATPLVESEKSFNYIEKTTLKADVAYQLTLGYLAKSLRNSNQAIQIRDEKRSKIISQVSFRCDDVQYGVFDVSIYETAFTVQADFKDNRVRLSLTGNNFTSYVNLFGGKGDMLSLNSPFSGQHQVGLKKCANKLKDMIMKNLQTSDNSDW